MYRRSMVMYTVMKMVVICMYMSMKSIMSIYTSTERGVNVSMIMRGLIPIHMYTVLGRISNSFWRRQI